MSHLKNYYGTECPHCERMMPLIEKLEKELGVTVDKKEVWHDEANAREMEEYDKDLCGGVPFLYNTENGKFVCGEANYEELKDWAKK